MFRGSSQTRVDEKGRLKIPADFKTDLGSNVEFFITSRDGKRAEIWPMPVWKKQEARLSALPASSKARQKFERTTNYYGDTVQLDSQGRVLLPQLLREDASLMAEVVVIPRMGDRDPEHPEVESLGFLEVTNHEQMRMQVKSDPLTDEEQDELAKAGL